MYIVANGDTNVKFFVTVIVNPNLKTCIIKSYRFYYFGIMTIGSDGKHRL